MAPCFCRAYVFKNTKGKKPMEKTKNTQPKKKWLDKLKITFLVSICMIIVGAFLSSMVLTAFFSVSVKTQSVDTIPVTSRGIVQYEQTGVMETCVADIYKPNHASEDNKVPLVFVVPGINRTKETQSSFNIELLRRGYAVICIDPFAQGESTSSYEKQSATQEGYGLFAWVDYVFEHLDDEFNYVDKEFVAAVGHSAGGNACQKLAEREGLLAQTNHTKSRINTVYITGYIRDFTWKTTACNVGISYSQRDEGAFQNKTAQKQNGIREKDPQSRTDQDNWWLGVGPSDLRYADESVALANYQLKRFDGSSVGNTEITYGESTFLVPTVEIGKVYGNPFSLTAVVVNNETCLHAFQPYDNETISHMLLFLQDNFETDTNLATTDQVWWLRELGGLLTLVGGFMFICCLGGLLLRTKVFASLKANPLLERTGNQKVKGRIFFWLTFAVGAVLACLSYMWCVQWSVEMFPAASGGDQTWFFPQRFTNAIMLWAVFNGIVGAALFLLTWKIEHTIDYLRALNKQRKQQNNESFQSKVKKAKVPLSVSKPNYVLEVNQSYRQKLSPLVMSSKNFAKTLALAAILIASFFAVDMLMYLVCHVDMRFMFLSARVSFNWRTILAILMYIPFFFIFYFSNSMRVNCAMRPKNWKEWLSQIIAVLANTLGLVAILFVQYIPFIQNGIVGYTGLVGPQWLFVNLLFSIIPMMALLPIMNRLFFNMTGKAWLGPLVTCVIFIVMTGGATTIYFGL